MPTKAKAKQQLVVVRTYGGGIHIGRLVRREGQDVTLADARRLWRWRGANTLHEVALHGVDSEYSRLSEPVPAIELPTTIEVIPVAESAIENLTTSRWGA